MRPFLILFFLLVATSCSTPSKGVKTKTKPEHSTEISDPQVKRIVEEFFKLSARKNLTFKKKVSIGFTKLQNQAKDGTTIGMCTTGSNFREIDIDSDHWKTAAWMNKVALVYHELAHCYCDRDHDHDNGIMYPDGSLKAILQGVFDKKEIRFSPMKPIGYMDDGCANSIMAPFIISNYCFDEHYDHYVKEMFEGCKPY